MTDFRKLALLLLPTFLRRPLLAALAQALVRPLSDLQRQLFAIRGQTEARLRLNGQVCHLRRLLNDRYDPIARQITITDAMPDEERDARRLFMRDENRHVFAPSRKDDALMISARSLAGQNSVDFLVHLTPESEHHPYWNERRVDELRALVRRYRLAGMRFDIRHRFIPSKHVTPIDIDNIITTI